MGYATLGTKITEFSKKTGPQGQPLQGDGETGLGSHTEATRSVKDRVKSPPGSTVGFKDTPEVATAFDSLTQARKDRETTVAKTEKDAGSAAEAAAAKVQGAAAEELSAGSQAVDGAARQFDVAKARQTLDRAKAAAAGDTADPSAGDTAADPPAADKGKKPKVAGKTRGDA